MIRWPAWWTDGVIRFLRWSDLYDPTERLVDWLESGLTRVLRLWYRLP